MKHFPFKKRVQILILVLILCSSSFLQGCKTSDTKDFSAYTDELFRRELSGNTLTLHYTLSNSKKAGIHPKEASLGIPSADFSEERDHLISIHNELCKFQKNDLSVKESLTLDTLNDYIDQRIQQNQFAIFDDPLLPSGGDAGQLPLLLAQFPLNSTEDVTDYLNLLGQVDDYLDGIFEIEKKRSSAGLFMSKAMLSQTLLLLNHFICPAEKHFLVKSFRQRLNKLSISKKIKKTFVKTNYRLVKNGIFPAYKKLIRRLNTLKKTCTPSTGLCHFKQGKKYYKSLIRSYTGCEDSADLLTQRIDASRKKALSNVSCLAAKNPKLPGISASLNLKFKNDREMVNALAKAMKADFPDPPKIRCRISYVDKYLRDYLAPAFYITSPIDSYMDNTIYINSASSYSDIHFFTTLAHESLPGHLYQTVMSYRYDLAPIRALLDYPGYTEGWATYIEMMSYHYAGLSRDLADFLMNSQIATISLYASSDIGIHYYGWNSDKLYAFWEKYGITDHAVVDQIAELILSDPGNYLKYYVGFLNFMDLQSDIRKKEKDRFSLKKFHKTLLEMGPTSFPLLRKYYGRFAEK